MAKMGRPRIELKDIPKDPYKLIHYLASIFCTQEEIATALGMSLTSFRRRAGLRQDQECDGRADTVDAELAKAYKEGRNDSKVTLRRLLKEHSKRFYAAAIFLAKNELGYTDKQAVEQTGGMPSITVVNTPQPPQDKPQAVPAMHIDARDTAEGEND